MSHSYNEDALVEQPAIQLFAEMSWQTLSAMEEVFGIGGTLGRETKGEAVLVPHLRVVLEWLLLLTFERNLSAAKSYAAT